MDHPPRVAIIGVTGFIGRGLPALLAQAGIACTGINRSGSGQVPGVDRWQAADALDLSGHSAVINLAGEPIDQRWNYANRARFHESRIGVTRRIVHSLRDLPAGQRPAVLINASAVGIYGDRGDEVLDESAAPGSGYLADLCREWEDAANQARSLGVRVVTPRIGIVLGRGGAAFQKLLLVFKTGLGGKLGSGQQWMPWIHLDDLRAALIHALRTDTLEGPVNCSAPSPLRNLDFTRQLAAALHRPAIFAVPGIALKIVLGGFGSALLAGQNTRPNALEASGFRFTYPTLESALNELLGEPPVAKST
jgi:uncharacterized protein